MLALGPALGPGLVLSYDMSFVPEPSFSWDQLGLGAQLPPPEEERDVKTAIGAARAKARSASR